MLAPFVSTITVPCAQQRAFEIFIAGMASWWPLEKRSMSLMQNGGPAKRLDVDARLGGRIVEVAADDTLHHWGTITVFNEHDLLAMDFHMGMPAENASLVEVRFSPLSDNSTEVELTQSNWEAFGDMAEMMRNGYGSSWAMLFEQAYGEACAAA